ncbi:hypothetical protein WJ63_36985 [Burkholderia pyrrocinia]|nr:hypothetical protein WJ63_36985 [Burkholderia pyrrocinia]
MVNREHSLVDIAISGTSFINVYFMPASWNFEIRRKIQIQITRCRTHLRIQKIHVNSILLG